ncbi:MAG TPA: 8-oxo-dGTP diphosphatase [Elusimicrobiota bacterium]|nr:8-oxo-dGTP diphosphatase [Elusimicrobiota bacterium]
MKLATLCYVRHRGRTLMMHRIRKKKDVHAGKWNGLGGKFLPGESPEDCVIREVKEESGLSLIRPRWHGVLTFPAFSHGEDWRVFVFTARRFTGRLTRCDEGDLRWIKDSELPSLNLWEGDRIFMSWLETDKIFSGIFVYRRGRLLRHRAVFY